MIETLLGIITAVALILISLLLNKYFTTKILATAILVAIAFIYVGFALSNHSVFYIVTEVIVALVFYFIALIGYTMRSSLIAYGIIAHGIWDMLHHSNWNVGAKIPLYWPSYCFTIDLLYGLYLLYYFKTIVPEQVASAKP